MVMRIEEKKKKYNSIVSDVNNALAGLVNKTEKEIDDYNKTINPVSGSAPPPCGSMKWNPAPGEDVNNAQAKKRRRKAQDAIESIISEINSDPIKFPDAGEMIPQKQEAGKGKGSMEGFFEVPELLGKPDWFRAIESGIGEMIGKPERGRKGIDIESGQNYISQGIGVFRKRKTKIRKPNKEIYILMDQSGSMLSSAFKNYNYLELLGAYIPQLADLYEGWFWVCDDCDLSYYEEDPTSVPNGAVKLENVTKTLLMEGGGGTSFDGAFAKLGDIERRKKEERGEDYEMCVIFFSDMFIDDYEFDNYRKLGPSKIMFVTGSASQDQLKPYEWIWRSDKHQVIIVDLDS